MTSILEKTFKNELLIRSPLPASHGAFQGNSFPKDYTEQIKVPNAAMYRPIERNTSDDQDNCEQFRVPRTWFVEPHAQ